MKEIMQEPAIVVGQDETIDRIARVMLDHQVCCVGVADDDGRLVGVIRDEEFGPRDRHLPFSTEKAAQLFGEWTTSDALDSDYAAARGKRGREIMVSLSAAAISEDAPLAEALASLQQGHNLLVSRGERAVGTLSRSDLLKLLCRDRQH